jgi:hypothetical protein
VAGEVVVAGEDTLGIRHVETAPSAAAAAAAVVHTGLASEVLGGAAERIADVPADIAGVLPEAHTEAHHYPHNSEQAAVGTVALATPLPAMEDETDGQHCGLDLAGAVYVEAFGPGERARRWDTVPRCSSDEVAESAGIAVVVPAVVSGCAAEVQEQQAVAVWRASVGCPLKAASCAGRAKAVRSVVPVAADGRMQAAGQGPGQAQ